MTVQSHDSTSNGCDISLKKYHQSREGRAVLSVALLILTSMVVCGAIAAQGALHLGYTGIEPFQFVAKIITANLIPFISVAGGFLVGGIIYVAMFSKAKPTQVDLTNSSTDSSLVANELRAKKNPGTSIPPTSTSAVPQSEISGEVVSDARTTLSTTLAASSTNGAIQTSANGASEQVSQPSPQIPLPLIPKKSVGSIVSPKVAIDRKVTVNFLNQNVYFCDLFEGLNCTSWFYGMIKVGHSSFTKFAPFFALGKKEFSFCEEESDASIRLLFILNAEDLLTEIVVPHEEEMLIRTNLVDQKGFTEKKIAPLPSTSRKTAVKQNGFRTSTQKRIVQSSPKVTSPEPKVGKKKLLSPINGQLIDKMKALGIENSAWQIREINNEHHLFAGLSQFGLKERQFVLFERTKMLLVLKDKNLVSDSTSLVGILFSNKSDKGALKSHLESLGYKDIEEESSTSSTLMEAPSKKEEIVSSVPIQIPSIREGETPTKPKRVTGSPAVKKEATTRSTLVAREAAKNASSSTSARTSTPAKVSASPATKRKSGVVILPTTPRIVPERDTHLYKARTDQARVKVSAIKHKFTKVNVRVLFTDPEGIDLKNLEYIWSETSSRFFVKDPSKRRNFWSYVEIVPEGPMTPARMSSMEAILHSMKYKKSESL